METKFMKTHQFEAWRWSPNPSRLRAMGAYWMNRWPSVTVVVSTKPHGIYATVTLKIFADRPEHAIDFLTHALANGMPIA